MESKLSRQELMNILGIKNDALKTIIRKNQLKTRLKEKGYNYVEKIKEGRNTYFIVIKVSDDKELLNNIVVNMFETHEEYKFSEYFMYRITNLKKPLTKKLLAENCDISRKTITKWDGKMIENNMLSKDGYFYVACDIIGENQKEYRLTDKYEYSTFVKNCKFIKMRKDTMLKWKNNEITDEEFQIVYDGTTLQQLANEKKFVYKVSKFSLNKDNVITKEIKNLICNLYDKNILDYNLEFLSK